MKADGSRSNKSPNLFPPVWCKKRYGLVTLLFLVGAINCRNLGTKVPPPPVLVPAEQPRGERVTQDGDNQQAVFSADGKKILFVSANRNDHSQFQVYEKDLSTNRETRLTFQKGDVSRPSYDLKGTHILYASTTDELKEDPPFLRDKLQTPSVASRLPFELQSVSEIYFHRLDGTEIQRLTQHPGFDGWPCVHKNDTITWTQVEEGRPSIKTKSVNSESSSPVPHAKAGAAQFCHAPDGKNAAWIVYSDDLKTSTLWTLKDGQPKQLAEGMVGLFSDLAWAPQSPVILFSYQTQPGKPWSIHSIRTDDTCLSLWSSGSAHERYPALSPDEKTLLYSSNVNKSWQIYRKSWGGPCPGPAK